MTTRIVVDLPDHVYRRIETLARQSQRDVNDVVADVVSQSVRPFPINANREAMQREAAAFQRLHSSLVKMHSGQYVAILDGNLVDHDIDPIALLRRVREKYPDRTVLRRKVEQAPEVILHFRSPRITSRP
jgi:hypothetical protein